MTEFKGYIERKANIKFMANQKCSFGCLFFEDVTITYEVTGYGKGYYNDLYDDTKEWCIDIDHDTIEPEITSNLNILMPDWDFTENTKEQIDFADYMNELERFGSFEIAMLGEITQEPIWEAVCEDEPMIVEGRVI